MFIVIQTLNGISLDVICCFPHCYSPTCHSDIRVPYCCGYLNPWDRSFITNGPQCNRLSGHFFNRIWMIGTFLITTLCRKARLGVVYSDKHDGNMCASFSYPNPEISIVFCVETTIVNAVCCEISLFATYHKRNLACTSYENNICYSLRWVIYGLMDVLPWVTIFSGVGRLGNNFHDRQI